MSQDRKAWGSGKDTIQKVKNKEPVKEKETKKTQTEKHKHDSSKVEYHKRLAESTLERFFRRMTKLERDKDDQILQI